MADRKLGKVFTGANTNARRSITYFECGSCQGLVETFQWGEWLGRRLSRRERKREDQLLQQVSNMKKCECARPADKLGSVPRGNVDDYYLKCRACQGGFLWHKRALGMRSNRYASSPALREKQARLSQQISNMKKCECPRPSGWRFEEPEQVKTKAVKQPPPVKKKAVAPQAPAASNAGKTSLIEDLAALTRLWEQGALTDDEFAAAKATVLGVSPPPNSP